MVIGRGDFGCLLHRGLDQIAAAVAVRVHGDFEDMEIVVGVGVRVQVGLRDRDVRVLDVEPRLRSALAIAVRVPHRHVVVGILVVGREFVFRFPRHAGHEFVAVDPRVEPVLVNVGVLADEGVAVRRRLCVFPARVQRQEFGRAESPIDAPLPRHGDGLEIVGAQDFGALKVVIAARDFRHLGGLGLSEGHAAVLVVRHADFQDVIPAVHVVSAVGG